MRYIIIGNSAAGNAAACSIRDRDRSGDVLILSDEPYESYYRPLMPFYLDDRVGFSGLFRDPATVPQGIEVRLGVRVARIDVGRKLISTNRGENLSYDRLLIATGGTAIRPAFCGAEDDGVYVLRSMADATAIKEAAEQSERAIVIGGGRVGTKAAMALNRRGVAVTVVEQGDRIVPLQFDRHAAGILTEALQDQGISVILRNSVSRVETRKGSVKGVTLRDGSTVHGSFIVAAVGIRPNSELAREANIAVMSGIVVDHRLRTTAPDVYAAGDVAETTDLVTSESIVPASWTSAVEMGRIAGSNMAGGQQDYPGTLDVLNSFVLAGIPTVSVGVIQPPQGRDYHIAVQTRGQSYRKLVRKGGRLVGALMVGDIEAAGLCTSLIKRGEQITGSLLEHLLAGRAGHAAWVARAVRTGAEVGRKDIPASAGNEVLL